MALGNTPRRETVFRVEAAKSYAFNMSLIASTVPVNLTGAVVRLVIVTPAHQGSNVVVEQEAVLLDASEGLCQFRLQAADLDLAPGEYPFDITFLPPSKYSIPLLKGMFDVGANVDFDVANTYTEVSAGTHATVDVQDVDSIHLSFDSFDVALLAAKISWAEQFESLLSYVAEVESNAAAVAADVETVKDLLQQAGAPFWVSLTQAEYDALTVRNPKILYVIKDVGGFL